MKEENKEIKTLEKRVSKIEEFVEDLKSGGLIKILNKMDFEAKPKEPPAIGPHEWIKNVKGIPDHVWIKKMTEEERKKILDEYERLCKEYREASS